MGRQQTFGRRNLSDYSRGLACSISALPDGLPARESLCGVATSNDRHRFAWLRDPGATTLPICIPKEQAKIIKQRFGR